MTGLTLAQRIEAAKLLPDIGDGQAIVNAGFIGALADDLLTCPFDELAAARTELAHLITPAQPEETPQ